MSYTFTNLIKFFFGLRWRVLEIAEDWPSGDICQRVVRPIRLSLAKSMFAGGIDKKINQNPHGGAMDASEIYALGHS